MIFKTDNKKKIFFGAFLLMFSISCDLFDQLAERHQLEITQEDSVNYVEEKLFLDFPCIPIPREPEYGLVTKVIDGDSFFVKMDEGEYEVRYIGINAPEFEGMTFDEASISKRANQELIEGKEIVLFSDISNTDRYGRLLRYVFLEGSFINLELVKNGFAQPKGYPPDIACQQLLDSAGMNGE